MLSVIVPVYNTKEYLPKCLDSVCAQTYQDMEIILIDDGSTDGSGAICEEYASKFDKVIVCHQENQGRVAARKRGIEQAKGDYVAFVDSDDWIDTDFYETLFGFNCEEADVITSGLIFEWPNRNEKMVDTFSEGFYRKDEIRTKIWRGMAHNKECNQQGITASVSNKLFKREKIKEIISEIDSGIVYHEDGAILYALMTRIDKLIVTHYCGYHYRQREDATMRTFSEDSFDKALLLSRCMNRLMLSEEANEYLREQINYYAGVVWNRAIRETCGVVVTPAIYIFPYHLIPKGSKVVLYGAGEVGRNYYHCIEDGKYVTLVSWVDQAYEKYGTNVIAPEEIKNKVFDYLVIAINKKTVAQEIAGYLKHLGIDEKKIIWEIPRRITNL